MIVIQRKRETFKETEQHRAEMEAGATSAVESYSLIAAGRKDFLWRYQSASEAAPVRDQLLSDTITKQSIRMDCWLHLLHRVGSLSAGGMKSLEALGCSVFVQSGRRLQTRWIQGYPRAAMSHMTPRRGCQLMVLFFFLSASDPTCPMVMACVSFSSPCILLLFLHNPLGISRLSLANTRHTSWD